MVELMLAMARYFLANGAKKFITKYGKTALDNLKNKIKPTNIIFVTVDPQRDTQEYLKDYIQYFKGDVIAVTGDLKEIKKLADNWNVFFERKGKC